MYVESFPNCDVTKHVHLATFIFVHVPKIMTLPHLHFIMTKINMTVPRKAMTLAHFYDCVTIFFG